MPTEENKPDPSYWDDLYRNQETAWDLGYVSTPLKEYFDQLTNKHQSILIPGCGNSYEAEYLLSKGFTNITVIDISPLLTERLKNKFGTRYKNELTILTGDFFSLKGQFDLIIEQTFFCALDPTLRKEYAEQIKKLLKPGGKLAGVFFDREFPEGPPFGGNMEEYRMLFIPHFEILKMERCYNSIAPRKNTEVFIIMKK